MAHLKFELLSELTIKDNSYVVNIPKSLIPAYLGNSTREIGEFIAGGFYQHNDPKYLSDFVCDKQAEIPDWK